MIDLDTIFDNIDEYSQNIDDLVRALKQAGINSFEEFKEAAREAGTPIKKTIQDQVADRFANNEEDDWNEAVRINTQEAYQNYLDSYPEGEYRSSARDRIEELDKNKPVYVNCQTGLRSYVACRLLGQMGYESYNLSGGYRLYESVMKDKMQAETAYPCGMDKE